MSVSPVYQLTVMAKRRLTPNMWRITLGGAGATGLPPDRETAYIKLRFAQPGSHRPLLRSYTIRAQRPNAIDIDFVRHAHGGPASHWAETVIPGTHIEANGPSPAKRVDPAADWFLLTGDMTALPAIAANIEALPATARGRAIIEVMDAADIQPVAAPAGLRVDWHLNPSPGEYAELLANAVRDIAWPPGQPSVWAAGEFRSILALRRHLSDERALNRGLLYSASYWQLSRREIG